MVQIWQSSKNSAAICIDTKRWMKIRISSFSIQLIPVLIGSCIWIWFGNFLFLSGQKFQSTWLNLFLDHWRQIKNIRIDALLSWALIFFWICLRVSSQFPPISTNTKFMARMCNSTTYIHKICKFMVIYGNLIHLTSDSFQRCHS